MSNFKTRKSDGQVFPTDRKSSRDSGNPSYVGMDKSQIEKSSEEISDYQLSPKYDSRKSFYGKAKVKRDSEGNIVLQSYDTDVAYIKDGKPVVKGTYSPTTLRHIKEFLKQHGFKADTEKQILKDYPESKEQEEQARKLEKEKSDSQFKSVAMVSSLGNIFHKDIESRNKWKLRMLKAGLGRGFNVPDDWDKLSEKEKEKRLDKVIEFAKSNKQEHKTEFGTMDKSGKVTKTMSINIGKVKSDDPLAYSYGYSQAKAGQPMSKDKDLAPEYVRGYKDAKAGKKI